MTKEIEIEFKNTLTKQQYEALLAHYKISSKQIHHQVNHYFDTPDWQLKNLNSGLRVRTINDYYECTLKEKSSTNIHLETTNELTASQAHEMLHNGVIHAAEVYERLQQLGIAINSLKLFGSLATDRVEIDFQGGTLVFDHSFYLQQDDYEVEYETNDEQLGYVIFEQFLAQHHIEKKSAQKKIARFMNALQQKG